MGLTSQNAKIELHSRDGGRKYLTPEERSMFIEAAVLQDRETRTFCKMLHGTGARISEVLNLTVRQIHFSEKAVKIETLKQRRKGKIRTIPISDAFLDELNLVHDLQTKRKTLKGIDSLLWPWSRRTGSRRIEKVMKTAKLSGDAACPKGLRHAFAVHCIMEGIPLPTLQKWMGHASIQTTAIYLQVSGKEERELASKIWK